VIKKISVLVDNDSWIIPYAEGLVSHFINEGRLALLCRDQSEIPDGDVCFMLGCMKIVSKENLQKNKYNLVVHESNLPKGKGFAPVAWQILEGAASIPVCLIEANSKVDSGDIWLKDCMKLNGTELHGEWRILQGKISVELAKKFVVECAGLTPATQAGKSSFFKKRTPKDSELDIFKSIDEQFNLLRIVDDINYPAFFVKDGIRYNICIEKCD